MKVGANEYRLEREYLEMLNQMMELSDASQLLSMDRMRMELHRKIMMSRTYAYEEDNSEFYKRSKFLMSNLDILLGFDPPQKVGTKASELHALLNSEAFQAFLEGKFDTIRTKYGQVSV